MQDSLFYDSLYDALEKAIAASGKPKKDLACTIYPGRAIDTAKSLLTRALSSENTDVHLTVEMLLTLMRETDPRSVLYFLCDEFGFDRPAKKTRSSFERDIRSALREMQDKFAALGRDLKVMENMNKVNAERDEDA